MPQTKFVLRCTGCKDINYVQTKNKQNVTENLTLKKYCPKCRQHTAHNEARLRK